MIEEFLIAQKELKIKEITDKLKNHFQIKYIYINLVEVSLPMTFQVKEPLNLLGLGAFPSFNLQERSVE